MDSEELADYTVSGSFVGKFIHPERARIELTVRLIKALERNSESTDVYNHKILYLTLLMFLVAIIQLMASLLPLAEGKWTKVLIASLVLVSLSYCAWKLGKEKL